MLTQDLKKLATRKLIPISNYEKTKTIRTGNVDFFKKEDSYPDFFNVVFSGVWIRFCDDKAERT